MEQKLEKVIEIFHSCFKAKENTTLCGGFSEPFYKAACEGRPAEIRFTNNYISSALHEISHWLIAGEKRRKLNDFGYWYTPDGRDERQQELFLKVEVMPQATELCLSLACKVDFNLSMDNIDGQSYVSPDFAQNVLQRAWQLLEGPKGKFALLLNTLRVNFWESSQTGDDLYDLKMEFDQIQKRLLTSV